MIYFKWLLDTILHLYWDDNFFGLFLFTSGTLFTLSIYILAYLEVLFDSIRFKKPPKYFFRIISIVLKIFWRNIHRRFSPNNLTDLSQDLYSSGRVTSLAQVRNSRIWNADVSVVYILLILKRIQATNGLIWETLRLLRMNLRPIFIIV